MVFTSQILVFHGRPTFPILCIIDVLLFVEHNICVSVSLSVSLSMCICSLFCVCVCIFRRPRRHPGSPRRHPGPPRTFKEAPRATQGPPRTTKEAPRDTQEAPRAAQEAPRGHPGPREHQGTPRGHGGGMEERISAAWRQNRGGPKSAAEPGSTWRAPPDAYLTPLQPFSETMLGKYGSIDCGNG